MVYHQLPVDEIINRLDANRDGLTIAEISKRRALYGANIIPQPKAKSLFEIFLRQFLNPLIYVLIAAAIISLVTGDVKDAVFIAVIIIFNSVLGTYQEWRAENSARALRDMVKVICRVKRDGRVYEIPSEELVAGDIVLLESGYKVPADMRLIHADNLSVEEALLTGESVAVNKNTEPLTGDDTLPVGDRVNMVFAATTVQKGRGTGIVVATAKDTQIGLIADSLRTTESEKPPLVRRMERFSKRISIIVLAICIILGVVGYLEGRPAAEVFFLMVAIGVSAIPEGLPIGLTVALSIGTRRMARKNVIVRKLPAVEGLGSCTLIASDKTGTLTLDQQSARKIYIHGNGFYNVTGQGYNGEGKIEDESGNTPELEERLRRFIMACTMANEASLYKTNEGWEHSGDAVDVAFLALAYKAGKTPAFFHDKAEIVKMVPYESENQFSAVFFKADNNLHFAMKGAPEIVANKLSTADKILINDISEQMAANGFRVLAIAGHSVETADVNNLPELELLGLTGMIDPLRPEAIDAVKECREAGIEVVMITGDHPATALAISKELGIAVSREEIVTGVELSEMEHLPQPEFEHNLRHAKVFARVSPIQKQRIVEAMKSIGHFVAVTGDGANDAPALKSAHIGVAMGAGTDLAKEASSIIVTDNNFASIAAGVEEGRFAFDNLRKIIYLLISTGLAEVLAIGLAIILGMPLPFLAVQLLWLNLVTNGIQDIALAFEKGDMDTMKKPPRKPEERIFDKLMNSQVIVSGVVIAGIVFALWWHLIYNLRYDEAHARTVVMMLMVLLQNFHVLNCRSETKSVFQIPLKNNYVLIGGMILAQLVHISASYLPGLSTTLQLDPITLSEWVKLLPTAAIVLVVMEIFKWIRRKNKSKANAVPANLDK